MAEDKRLKLLRAVARAEQGAIQLMEGIEGGYSVRGFDTSDADTLFRGLVSEVGELADVLNIWTSPVYKARPEKLAKANAVGMKAQVGHELGDILTYVAALALHFAVVPRFGQWGDDRTLVTEAIPQDEDGSAVDSQ